MTDNSPTQVRERSPSAVLAMLVLVYTFNFIDRQIVGILAQPIKADLNLSDTELGLMGGLAFALLYTSLAIPIGALADRADRSWIITISLSLWSGFTALCGLATNFWQLFLCRLGVGVGEAGGVAPSYALIADYFPPERRARANAVFNFGIPIGSALGILLGGFIAQAIDWRTAFIAVGLMGLLIAPLFKFVVREPPRGRYDRKPNTPGRATLAATIAALVRQRVFWLLAVGAGCSSLVGYGLIFWLPSFFARSFGLSLVEVSLFMGGIILAGGIGGIWAGGWLADRLGSADRGVYARVPAIAFLITAPGYALGVLAPNPYVAAPLFLLPQALSLMWLGPVLTAVQHLAPASSRAAATAVFLFVNNLIGLGAGTLFFGFVSDQLAPRLGEASLKGSILIGLGFYVVASLLMWRASKRLAAAWQL